MMVPDSFKIGFVSALAVVNFLEAVIYALNLGYVPPAYSATNVAIELALGLLFLGFAIQIFKDSDFS